MESPRRNAAPDAKRRSDLLDATEQLLIDGGYATVTSRSVAEKAGLNSKLVHYYFHTMDDLFVAVFRRRAEESLQRQALAAESEQPLWALWTLSMDPAKGALTNELVALSRQRPVLRQELVQFSKVLRRSQGEAVSRAIERSGIELDEFPAVAISLFATSLSRVIAMEESMGFGDGHTETLDVVERWLTRIEGPYRSDDARAAAPTDRRS